MGCQISIMDPDLVVYGLGGNVYTSDSVDSSGILRLTPIPGSPILSAGANVLFGCRHGQQLALDGQDLGQTNLYVYTCPIEFAGGEDITFVDIGRRLSCGIN